MAICLLTSHAQVTIGSGSEPSEATLLHLKENNNIGENSSAGLLLPRVYLENKLQLYPMFKSSDYDYNQTQKTVHAGLIVYNLTDDSTKDLCPGPYVWNGNQWDRLWEACAPPAPPVEIKCSDIYVTGYLNQSMESTTPNVQIPYTLTSGTSYNLPAGTIGTYGGVIANVRAQTLTASGNIDVYFTGTPTTTMSQVAFPIDVAGSTCIIYLSVMKAPVACPNGATARAFVFKQDDKWYVLTKEAQTIACNTEEEALRHPQALQYCNDSQTSGRCIVLFSRGGENEAFISMGQGASIVYTGGCFTSLIFYAGSEITDTQNNYKKLGAVNVSGGVGQFGHISSSKTAIMTNKQLR
ncbi:hypothetical protein M2463_002295 [Parabacteroides sp. PH5-13]|nr:hypothetical protein [Parabacteroides sp. PH5-39]MDH6316129.1 hypothetical protein [Parabacteroides sp. PF5-13]MDH6320279.1 hypothetical protein [Parabacteroides sp. PH5-13]MDH6346257.1 hypothetical protein [Parabacteroides sp. PH5-46]MDH6361142.1 hypothetical protein [Parabacteroides sp. PH5-16]MDH6376886.1 hypothetical protein [Parabacteroides sp. PH5-33]MDH6394477.1 hypothetical protein [Parabacteroides sp. PFB2-22]MDH6407588.1 hypothetical protein [Parabacteroides sp. PH5-26]